MSMVYEAALYNQWCFDGPAAPSAARFSAMKKPGVARRTASGTGRRCGSEVTARLLGGTRCSTPAFPRSAGSSRRSP